MRRAEPRGAARASDRPRSDWSLFLSLFGSASTWACCALPALFVALGAGATFAGIVAEVPGLIWMSEHKGLFLAFGGGALLLSGASLYRARNAPCPIDPALARACTRTRRRAKALFFASAALYVVGAGFGLLAG